MQFATILYCSLAGPEDCTFSWSENVRAVENEISLFLCVRNSARSHTSPVSRCNSCNFDLDCAIRGVLYCSEQGDWGFQLWRIQPYINWRRNTKIVCIYEGSSKGPEKGPDSGGRVHDCFVVKLLRWTVLRGERNECMAFQWVLSIRRGIYSCFRGRVFWAYWHGIGAS